MGRLRILELVADIRAYFHMCDKLCTAMRCLVAPGANPSNLNETKKHLRHKLYILKHRQVFFNT